MRKWILLAIIFASIQVSFSSNEMKNFYENYRQGKYLKAIKAIESVNGNKKFQALKSYLLALCYKNLQSFDEANVAFQKAWRLGHRTKEFHYEFGQSLYAANELEHARNQFMLSFKKNYKKDSSLYYQAHISEILEEHPQVKKNYMSIIKDPKADSKLKQVAFFRLAELVFKLSKNKVEAEHYIVKYVVPLLDRGIKIDPDSETARDMERRYDQILLEFNIHPLTMVNGRRIRKEGTQLRFTQKIYRDSNVTLENDQSSTSSTLKPSMIYDSNLFFGVRWIFGKRFLMHPEMNLFYTYYADQDTPEVFQNDTTSIAPALRNSFDHKIFKRRATFFYDFEYNYTQRDRNQTHSQVFYGRTVSHIFGEKVRIFKKGDTTFKLKLKGYSSYDSANDYKSTIVSLDQIWVTKNKNIFIYLFMMDSNRNIDPSLSTTNYLFRLDYLLPNVWRSKYSLNLAASYSLLDTELQKATRGVEKNIYLSLKLNRTFGKHLKLGLFYDFTDNSSLDTETYTYQKNVYGAELRLNF